MSKYALKIVEIEINSQCNRKCKYCPNSISERKHKGDMNFSLFLTIMKQLKEIKFEGRISFHFYGEPFLSKNLNSFVKIAKHCLPNARQVIYSNGDFITPQKIIELFNNGVDLMVITNHSGRNIEDIILKTNASYRNRIVLLTPENLNLTNRGGLLKCSNSNSYLNEPCYIPSNHIIITVNGNVLPCYEDYNETLVFGNVNRSTIKEIWNSSSFNELRSKLEKGMRSSIKLCSKCNNTSCKEDKQYDYVL